MGEYEGGRGEKGEKGGGERREDGGIVGYIRG
jgi:hypothetical protein